jgi:CheY-like chemotaxis protein/nitrogen-specific signal transduction histidine kinase
MSLDVIKDKEDKLFVSFMRDISDEIKAEEELIQSRNRALVGERAKAEFLTTISHEIRTPMNGLMWMIDLLKETKTTEKQRKYIDSMSDSGSSTLQHVNNVLEITKYDSGQTVVEPEEFDLNDLVTEVLQLQSMIAKKSGNTMHHRWDGPQTGILKGDKEKLQKILFSLVDNANKFSQNSDVIIQTSAVAMEQGQICVRLAVIDNGIGIERSDFERIFEDFTTLDGSYRRVAEGAGLGLGVAQRFAIALGGEISVESKIGSGSAFAVKVPLAHISDSPIERDPAQAQTQSGVRGLRILMVEDNEINRIVLRETLTQNGHQVVEAGDGETGVKLSEAEAFDVILMDISMPMMDGVEASDHIRRGQGLSSKAPIFAITAHCTPNEIKKFKKAGINAVLSKPIKKSQLFTKLKEVGIMRKEENGAVQGEHGVLDMSTDIIDLEKIAELKDQLGVDVLKTLLDRLVNETEEMIEGLCAPSALDSDVTDLIKAIHKVAGSSAALGATEMRKTLNQLELLGKESDTPTVVSRVGDLKDIWHISKESLKNHGLLNA